MSELIQSNTSHRTHTSTRLSLSLSLRPKRTSSEIKESAREAARNAVDLAVKEAFRTAFRDTLNGGKISRVEYSSNDSHASLVSHERAIHRGSKRGSFEESEVPFQRPHTFSEDSDSHPTTPSRASTRSSKRKNSVLLGSKKSSNQSSRRSLTAEISNEAWMCGVCAKSFSSFDAAEKHEEYHVREVVTDLGWFYGGDGLVNAKKIGSGSLDFMLDSTSFLAPRTPDRNTSETLPETSTKVIASQPRPDMLRVSTPALSTRVSFQPYNTPALQRKKRQIRKYSDDVMSIDDMPDEEFALTASTRRSFKMSPIAEDRDSWNEHDLLVPHGMKDYVVLSDEALVDVCRRAEPLMLTPCEKEAEFELEWLTKDKAYYDLLSRRVVDRQRGGKYSRFRTEGKTMWNKVQNKFVDAYQLMKEGKKKGTDSIDHYNRKLKGDAETQHIIDHTQNTLYVNVIVKNSIKVVSYELQRLAKKRWEAAQSNNEVKDIQAQRFQAFRARAQDNLVKLAGMALASDFTPRRIAVQLSNDLYRLLTPRLKRRGVVIETEIEYRVGPFFVLAVNIRSVNWRRMVKTSNRDLAERRSRWRKENEHNEEEEKAKRKGVLASFFLSTYRLMRLTKYEVLAQFLAWCHYFHWIIYTPICFLLYHSFLGPTFREYFLSSVIDEIFFYVEQKGMEMDIGIRDSSTQAAFMLSALREIRADGREQKKKQDGESTEKVILGPLLGPSIKDDKGPAPPMPPDFEIPENLEYVGLELDLPVGFKRIRWALLSSQSTFMTEAVFRAEAKYDQIKKGTWSKHDDTIGLPTVPDSVNETDFIGAEVETSYLMPKSAFVSANMAYETAYIEAYNNYCFSLKKKGTDSRRALWLDFYRMDQICGDKYRIRNVQNYLLGRTRVSEWSSAGWRTNKEWYESWGWRTLCKDWGDNQQIRG